MLLSMCTVGAMAAALIHFSDPLPHCVLTSTLQHAILSASWIGRAVTHCPGARVGDVMMSHDAMVSLLVSRQRRELSLWLLCFYGSLHRRRNRKCKAASTSS